jgi:hypothetical protein
MSARSGSALINFGPAARLKRFLQTLGPLPILLDRLIECAQSGHYVSFPRTKTLRFTFNSRRELLL